MTPSDSFVTRLVSRLRSMPENVAKQFIREAAADICKRTHCWTDTIELTIPAGWGWFDEIKLPDPPPWHLAHIYRTADGPHRLFQWTGTGFRCNAPVLVSPGDHPKVRVELVPETYGPSLEEIPESVWNMAGDAILECATALAAGQLGQPWGNAAAYQSAKAREADEVNRIVNTLVRGRTRMRIYQEPPIGELG